MLFVFAITIYYCLEVYHFAIYQAIFFQKHLNSISGSVPEVIGKNGTKLSIMQRKGKMERHKQLH